jgi:DivIVA domain-containing protein
MRTAFNKVKRGKGYSVSEVDAFFDTARSAYEKHDRTFDSVQIQNASFALERGGYETDAVDSALDRLTVAMEAQRKEDILIIKDEAAWNEYRLESTASLTDRIERPAGKRFKVGAEKEPAYSIKEVDALLDKIGVFLKVQTDGGKSLSRKELRDGLQAEDITKAVFASAKGENGYEEKSVDAFLAKAFVVYAILIV